MGYSKPEPLFDTGWVEADVSDPNVQGVEIDVDTHSLEEMSQPRA